MRQAFQDAFMQKTAAEWEPLFDEAGVPGARVRTVPEIMNEPHVVERATYHTFTAAETGLQRELKVPLTPFRLARGGAKAETPPKPVGADTDAILQSLGYSDVAIARLRTEKAV
jgi:crotonobetainyl-CoA:carnitine CoA-transferase CaiB-like acyl-CoA transferase